MIGAVRAEPSSRRLPEWFEFGRCQALEPKGPVAAVKLDMVLAVLRGMAVTGSLLVRPSATGKGASLLIRNT